jgi:hypothetical protein
LFQIGALAALGAKAPKSFLFRIVPGVIAAPSEVDPLAQALASNLQTTVAGSPSLRHLRSSNEKG